MKNKYNLGDKVWLIEDNKIVQEEITTVAIKNGEIYYGFDVKEKAYGFVEMPCSFTEEKLFPTKEELIKSL